MDLEFACWSCLLESGIWTLGFTQLPGVQGIRVGLETRDQILDLETRDQILESLGSQTLNHVWSPSA